jgi:hypothetical protein
MTPKGIVENEIGEALVWPRTFGRKRLPANARTRYTTLKQYF